VIGTFGRGGRGAGSSGDGGAGHWGGGGGGAGPGSPVGAGGFGAGKGGPGQQIAGGSDGDGGGGGGGLGAGGDIFVQLGGKLTIVGGSLMGGTANGGAGGPTFFGAVAQPGQGLGGGLFLQGNETITLAPTAGATETISGVIADQTGSGGTGRNAGLGALVIAGGGTVDLGAANTFKGGVTIDSGVLELANPNAGGTGGIDFATGSAELLYAAGANLANPISGFGGSDAIDFSQLGFATGDHAVDNGGQVAIETSVGQTIGGFDVSGTYASANFSVGKDTSGQVLVTYAATSTLAAVNELGGGSLIGLLGRYGSQVPTPIPETHSGDPAGLYSLLRPVLGAETLTGAFGSPREGNAGGARDGWGVAVGWNETIGHGPGSSGT
jgi:autotransporter-associated beta strand protein